MKKVINNTPEASGDRVNYRSDDGLVAITTKVTTAKRWPRHNYPVVCMQLVPSPGTRVQKLTDGSGGVDVLLTHREVAEHLKALSAADPSSRYEIPQIPEKPHHRKAKWQAINRRRRGNKRRD